MRFSRKNHYILISIFLLGFIIRLIFALQSNDIPLSDASVYDRLALSIAKGQGYVDSSGEPHSLYPPFYPAFLAIIYTFFGHSYLAVRIIQSIIGAFTCVLIYLIGKRAGSVAVGTIAAFICIIYLPFIKSAELLLTELVFTFLLALIVLYLLKIQKDAGFKNCVILGFLLGAAALTKSVMLAFLVFIIPVFIYSQRKYFLKRYALVLLFFSLSIAPWVIRNYNIYHRLVPITAEGGYCFYSSYRPQNGIFGLVAAADDPVIVEAGKISSPILRNNFLFKKTLDFIANNPGEILRLEVKKILYLWAPFDWEIVGNRWFNFVYAAILPFFGLGFILAAGELRKNYPVLAPVIFFQIIALIFYGSPRFRLPIEPYIFILSAIGILECWKILSKKISRIC